jgi:hypothetical protein
MFNFYNRIVFFYKNNDIYYNKIISMRQKIILTAEQHEKVMNHLLSEMLTDSENLINEDGSINEGFLDKIKHSIAMLGGRYKVGDKYFWQFKGKKKVEDDAIKRIQDILAKQSNIAIQKIDAEIKERDPKFPNSETQQQFLQTVMSISSVYDTLVSDVEKKEGNDKQAAIDIANGVINDLRDYVKKFLDIDLKSAYSLVDEVEGRVKEISEEELKELDEIFGLNEASPEDNQNQNTQSNVKAGDVRDKLKADTKNRGGKANPESEKMKTLKSNKLPLILAGIGGALGGLSWLAQTEWFKEWLEGLLGGDTTVTTPDIVKDVTGGAPDSKGMLHWMGQIDGHEMKTGADVQGFIDKYGADNVKHMFDGNGGGPSDTQIQQLQQLVGGENASKPVGELFNPQNDTFGSMKGGQNLFGVSKAASFLGQIVVKKGITTVVKGAGTALAAKFAGLGAVLQPIGIGVLVAGALVKLMRLKGQKWSRAATLDALYQSLRNIEGGKGVVEPEGETINSGDAKDPKAIDDKNKEGGAGDEKTGGGTKGVGDDDLYNSLQNLFRFIVASNKKFGAGPTKDTSAGAKEDGGAEEVAGGFKVGDRVKWKTKKGTEATGVIVGPSRDKEGLITVKSDKRGNAFDIRPSSLQTISGADAANNQAAPTAAGKKTKAKAKTNIQEEENMLDEAKYFRDTDVVKYLNKNLSPNRVKEFENFMNRIEQIRNKIRNMEDIDDKVFNQKIATIKNNPIILTDFNKLFNVSSANPQAYQNLAKFINDIFNTVYTGKFKKGELIDKLGTMGKVPAKDLDEAGKQAGRSQFENDAQDRKKFKGHLMSFLTDAIGLFQYMFQQRKNTAAKGGNQQNTDKQAAKLGLKPKPERKKTVTPPNDDASVGSGVAGGGAASKSAGVSESENLNNKLINEELERIKKIMGG